MKWTRNPLLFGAICLCFAPGVWAQSAKAVAPPSGSNDPAKSMTAPTGCGYSSVPVPVPGKRGHDEKQSSGSSLVLISSHDDYNSEEDAAGLPAITGLWHFTFTAKGNDPPGPPDGAPVDSGFVTWHSDGTELMNSGRAPTTGDFCMGVWKPIGRSTYKLNHFALAWAWDPITPTTAPGTGGADFVGPANIREVVTLDRTGDHYAGTFTLVQYAQDGTTVLATVTGTVTATRIKAD